MRKLVTAGHSYTVQSTGLNQSFMIATENHAEQPINIHGPYNAWVLECDYRKLRDSLSRLFEAEDMFTVEKVKKEIAEVIRQIEGGANDPA